MIGDRLRPTSRPPWPWGAMRPDADRRFDPRELKALPADERPTDVAANAAELAAILDGLS